MGVYGLGPIGLMEADPLLVQAEQKLMGQADELIVLADSSKFTKRSSLVLCPLSEITTVITDDGIPDAAASMLEVAGVSLYVVSQEATKTEGVAS